MSRDLSPAVAKGMYGGRTTKKGNYAIGNQSKTSKTGRDAYSHPTSVNGNLDTVRKPAKKKPAAKRSKKV
jgi:hypothetical protein